MFIYYAVAVNQAFRLRALSQVFHPPYVWALRRCGSCYPRIVGMSVLVHLLSTPPGAGSEMVLTNTQLGPPLGGWCPASLLRFGLEPPAVVTSHTCANGGLRLFAQRVSERVSE